MRSLRIGALLGSTLLLVACRGGPTLDDARDFLHEGDPESALEAARGAAGRAAIPKDRLALRRVAFRASLSAGWSHEAAREYLELRRLTGHEDPQLLSELSRATLGMALRCADGGRRLHALSTLAAVNDLERVRARVMAALNDERAEVRAASAAVVATLPNADEAFSGLQRAARDPSARVRGAAVDAVRRVFLPRLPSDERSSKLEALVGVGLKAAEDPSAQVRLNGVDLLGVLADHGRAREGLVAAVGNGSDSVSLRAAQRLLAVDPKLAHSAWERARRANRTLASFGRSLALHVGKGSAAAVQRDLRSASYRRRLGAVQGLAGPAAAGLAPALGRLVRRDPATMIRLAALRALLALGGDEASSAVAAGLAQDDPAVRRVAFGAAQASSPWSADRLAQAFDDPATSLDAARSLLARCGAEGSAVVRAGLGQVTTRWVAAKALAEREDPSLRDLYVGLLEDDDPRIRKQGAMGLISCGLVEDRILLVQAMLRPEQDSDVAAAAALMAIQARTGGATSGLQVQ